jgi:peptidoglycan-associated lipoprotein
MRTKRWFLLSGLLVAAALGAGCHTGRPPALLTPAGAQGQGTQEGAGALPPPSSSEQDIRAIGPEGLASSELSSAYAGGEGGPLADVYFEFDQATLTDAARGVLEKHVAWLQTRRETRVLVEGHCDERGTVEYNLALGDKRARAARDYLVSLGVAAARVTTVSLGKERPLEVGHDEGTWARNRRAHFVVQR